MRFHHPYRAPHPLRLRFKPHYLERAGKRLAMRDGVFRVLREHLPRLCEGDPAEIICHALLAGFGLRQLRYSSVQALSVLRLPFIFDVLTPRILTCLSQVYLLRILPN